MAQFLGTYQNKLDTKGRVSIPAPFRSVLKQMSSVGEGSAVAPLVLRPSHQYPCIEAWTQKGFEALSAPLEAYSQFSQQHADLAIGLFGDACGMETDREGRITLSSELAAHANIHDTVSFIGASNTFQIWEPAAGALRLAEAKAAIRAANLTLRTVSP
jgi:MraZ protein